MANVTLSEELRKRLGIVLAGYVNAGEGQVGSDKQWWAVSRGFHNNDPVGYAGTRDDPGFEIFHTGLSGQRQDALTAQVCNVVGKQEPVMLNTSDEQEIANAKQKIVDRVWLDANFRGGIEIACGECTDSDMAFWRVCPLGPGQIEMSVHLPEEVVVFPALPSGIADVTAIGHMVQKRQRDVDTARKNKIYYFKPDGPDNPLPASGDQSTNRGDHDVNRGVNQEAGPLPRKDQLVELWDLCVYVDLDDVRDEIGEKKAGDKGRWYRTTVSRDAQEVLAFEEYPYSRPWYFRSRLIGSKDYYASTSVGRNLIPLQREWNNLHSAMYAGIMAGVAPPIFGPKLSNNEKYTKYGAYDYIETDSPVQPWSPNVHPQLAPIPVALQMIERSADEIAGISQNTTGGDSPSQTATEASIVASGVASKVEQYIRNFTADFPDMARFTLELVADDWDEFAARMEVPLPPDELMKPATWATKGTSPAHSPQAIVQAVMTIMPIATNPMLATAAGIKLHALVRAFLENSALQNYDGIQLTAEQIANTDPLALAGATSPAMVGPAGGPGGAGVPGAPA